jgi:serine/threonine protein kinase/tetratricopeptide (TPR) repeat protein
VSDIPDDLDSTRQLPIEDQPSLSDEGRQIGPYRLLQKIGEGGMGEVWLAEQSEPIRRRVALKVIKQGMDTRQVVARFEAERQALALMDHPCVAKVFDAGVTPRGRPYFVMEYVKGVPLTEYCDRNRLTQRDRLELFRTVCDGVQHAHLKAIIHRDLKPSNILVSEVDGRPVPKIIDFGVAKATAQRLTERTVFTELGVLIGTPEYMSPEQAQLTGEDVDTRTDVYSLGVILYELLVGALPFDSQHLRSGGLEGIRRMIREQEPKRPSTRVATLGDRSNEMAKNRRTDPTTMRHQLEGDLDWITMKAMDKDRTRRYDSPAGLAAELARYMNHEPVLARPPSTAYRARKFVRRHRGPVAAVACVVVALIIGTVASTVLYLRSEESRTEATAVAQFLGGMISDVNPSLGSKDITVRQVLDRASSEVDNQFRDQPLVAAYLDEVMASSYQGLGNWKESERHAAAAERLRRNVLGNGHPLRLRAMRLLAAALRAQSKYEEANRVLDELISLSRRSLGEESPDTLAAMAVKAEVLIAQGTSLASPVKIAEGEALARTLYEIRSRRLGDDHPDTINAAFWIAHAALRLGRSSEAEARFRDVLERRSRVLGPEHPAALATMNDLGWALNDQAKHAEAEDVFRQALEIRRRILGDHHPDTLMTLYNLGCVSATSGDKREALEWLGTAIEGGFGDVDVMGKDPDLASLRGTPEYDRLFAAARSNYIKLAGSAPPIK